MDVPKGVECTYWPLRRFQTYAAGAVGPPSPGMLRRNRDSREVVPTSCNRRQWDFIGER